MPNESPSKNFERQIERIHRLLKAEGSEVTWNDRIPDPDNPSQARQIDITIRKGGQTTLVECRVHKSRQDVNWIQELIGRRESLRADAVIAVSASGFTAGAIAKAEKFGVILRDLWTLRQMEIASWGTPTKVNLVYYEFDECLVTFTMPAGAIPKRPAFTNGRGRRFNGEDCSNNS
jgi:hypothetical protein